MLEFPSFSPTSVASAFPELRAEVRSFLAEEIAEGRIKPDHATWTTFDADFSRRCGARGFIGITWPEEYGGRRANPLERHAINEELIAGGAPVGAHWIADRQSGQQILAHGNDHLRSTILPRIAAGECYFGIGMSEPDAGSDLANIRTRATRADGGWRLNGHKIWTTNAHKVDYLTVLARTGPVEGKNRHAGLTQFIVDLRLAGITIKPITDIVGRAEFNEVIFDNVLIPDSHLLGEEGAGWKLVIGELAFERSGPDRFLSNTRLLLSAMDRMSARDDRATEAVGGLLARLTALRTMSLSVAASLARGEAPNTEAVLVKDVGTKFEQAIPETLRRLMPLDSPQDDAGSDDFRSLLATNILSVPSHTLRGGTTEILRGIISRDLGLR